MKTHWLECLPEVGGLFMRQAATIIQRKTEIAVKQAQIQGLEGDVRRLEADALELIISKQLWTEEEITKAKEEADKCNQ